MKFEKILFTILIILCCVFATFGQRIVKGRVIDIDFLPLPGVQINLNDSTEIEKTDFDGFFEITLPMETSILNFYFIGYEPTKITFPNDCDYLEVIILSGGCYLNTSNRKIDKLRNKSLDQLNEVHLEAFKKGLFKFEKPCFKYMFLPNNTKLDEISRQAKFAQKQLKKKFKELAVGDTITIPYGSNYGSVYSIHSDETEFDCLIKVVLIDKYKKKGRFNLLCKITDTNECQYESIEIDEKEVKTGELIEYNMRYFKILTE